MTRRSYDRCDFGAARFTRRDLLSRAGMGFGLLALGDLVNQDRSAHAGGTADVRPELRRNPHAKARNVIFLFMAGGPSHVDTFDPKPELTRLSGEQTPDSILRTLPRSALMGNGTRKLLGSPFRFAQYGESGLPVSELFTQTGAFADELCVIRSMRHENVIHTPAEFLSTTGSQVGDRPSLGSWILYGLGSENQNLPGFIVLGHQPLSTTYGHGFLPARYQGIRIDDPTRGIANIALPDNATPSSRQLQLGLIERLNREHAVKQGEPADSDLEARIRSYELAFRMQTAAPEAFDLAGESAETHALYGLNQKESHAVGQQCLLARRFVERGVRFVQIRVYEWDSHANIQDHRRAAAQCDRPIAGLLADLKRRGMLENTLVVWGGEFGRTPGSEQGAGRDHSPGGFSMWLAGGGARGGKVIGATDDVGYTAIEKPYHPTNLFATILYALGIEQDALYFDRDGRKEIATVTQTSVIREAFV